MYNYIIGTVTDIIGNAIVVENQNIGYLIYTPNPFDFEENKVY